MKKIVSLLIITLLLIVVKQTNIAHAQPNNEPFPERLKRIENENLNKPYEGIITSKGKEKGLYPLTSTGVTTEPIKKAAEAFLKSLSKDQLPKTHFDSQNKEWQKWSNVDNGLYKRQGVSIKEMSQQQRKLAFALMQTSLSAKGLQLGKDIMKTDQTLRELNNDNPIYDEELYFFTIMGKPSMNEPWGWQVDGHHLVINYFIVGDQVVMTPVFMGGEPIITTSGKYLGNTLFQDEQNTGLKFMQSLSSEQQRQATLSEEKRGNNIEAEAFSDNKTVDFQGLATTKMTEAQKEKLVALTHQYISNMREGHAKVKMEDIKKHLDNTWFAWIGKTDEEAVFYYRIHSPVILIEFDHQSPIGIRGQGRGATRNHIHTIVRTPNGNDYGKDLLRQHLEQHHNHK
ncbi:DUF3500 domain-containing protein [Rhodocytophaga rosea]|uniref:DUF3500 domain-containing protein n=1 Tax=Rhodocytophaga rosea TaxID=2704465 RepID=A0A6C0GEH3_9BACT|nr:DUF3500 domain-containing protein [Rhodocytophaga rosea]QHT66224.1 DUF3500 domain-containing protein [Rhodocytophaga rosea]